MLNSKKSHSRIGNGARALVAVAIAAAGNLWGQAGTSGNPTDPMALLQSISTELRALHRELLEDRREYQQHTVRDLEHQLGAIQEQERQIQGEQNSRVQQAADIEAQLQQPNLEKPEREELEAQRSELLNAPVTNISAHNALSQRESQVRERLALQEQRMQAIERQLQQLSMAAP